MLRARLAPPLLLSALAVLGGGARAQKNDGFIANDPTSATIKPVCRAAPQCNDADDQSAECASFVHIAALFPLSGNLCLEGIQSAASAKLAVQDINSYSSELNKGLLADRCLVIHISDTEGRPGKALGAADLYINTPWTEYANIDLVLGGLRSTVTEAVRCFGRLCKFGTPTSV
eukprot:SAG31_NODE_8766_length_1391_cov_1.715170_1_plen_174_part_00